MPENSYFVYDFEVMEECNGHKVVAIERMKNGSIIFILKHILPDNYFVEVVGHGRFSFTIKGQNKNSFAITFHNINMGKIMFIIHEY